MQKVKQVIKCVYRTTKFLHLSKFKAFEDDKVNLTEKLKSVMGKVESIVGKRENTGLQH